MVGVLFYLVYSFNDFLGVFMATKSSTVENRLLTKLASAGEQSRENVTRETLQQIMDLVVATGLVQEPEVVTNNADELNSSADLGVLVVSRRKVKNLTQEALSDLASVSVGTVKNIESGGNVRVESILRVTKVLGLRLLCQK